MIQAPLSGPKAICHAGSRAWKYSSGWKKVCMKWALMMRKMKRPRKTAARVGHVCEVVVGV